MANLEIPSKIRVIIGGGKPMSYKTLDYCEMIARAFNHNGHKEVTVAHIKRQLWCLLNNHTLDFVGEWLKDHVVTERAVSEHVVTTEGENNENGESTEGS